MTDPNERLHQEWLGMAQPDGLVVTSSALKSAEANITWPVIELQAELKALGGETKVILEPKRLFCEILGWSEDFIVKGESIPESLRVALEGGEQLAPKFALRSADDENAFALVVGQPDKWNTDLDTASDDKRWSATPHQKFERLLRETGVHVGLLMNAKVFRLVYAPKGESAGWITFRLSEMLSVDGRPLLGAFHMLLNERRLLSLEPSKRLLGLLKASREYQNTVSNTLREQVLAALRELVRGFEHADRIAHGAILSDLRREHLQEVYIGLVTVLMRSVFVLFAEERGLLPMENDLYASSYSLSRLYAQLVEDHNRFGEGLDDRYGAWARTITLFRVLHDGVHAAADKPQDELRIPERRGDFFNPDAFPFLEGRHRGSARQVGEPVTVPRVSDGVVYRVLDQLLILGGERLQYRGLDVEQIGSVYEGLMGFELEVAVGESVCVKPEHVVVNLEELLRQSGPDRLKTLKANAGLDLKDKAANELKAAKTLDALQAALSRRISERQPGRISKGSLYLQPGDERRKSGSHYTPKSLTSPIVETTLRPVLERLGPNVTPEQLLELKICDPAMGSAAFLVEACRQLSDHLVAAWRRTGTMPELPPDEDPLLHARRLIAQRCLYGVDKNPLAVDLARLSMWLVTFAKEHPFTFVDHALRAGDSLVGLSHEQIASLSLDVSGGFKQLDTVRQYVLPALEHAEALRNEIHAIGDPPDNEHLVELWRDATEELEKVRFLGDLVVAAFFSTDSDKARKTVFKELATKVTGWLATGQYEAELRGQVAELREGEKPLTPFHWEVEFPEVFSRHNRGFDCFIGNPPFAGKNTLASSTRSEYPDWLKAIHLESHGNSDIVAHFFRRAFSELGLLGCLGFVATNTLAQGDTRATGLGWICRNGGSIYEARRRLRWPGTAAVVVNVVHICRGSVSQRLLDGTNVESISAFLFHRGGSDDPATLRSSSGRTFGGAFVLGMGFVFDDESVDKGASSLAQMHSLLARDARNAERIFPYIGGEDLSRSPNQSSARFIIDFEEMTETQARSWPELFNIINDRVRPTRQTVTQRDRRELWWLFATRVPEVRQFLRGHRRVLVTAQTAVHLAFSFAGAGTVFANTLVVCLLETWASFAALQARVHEVWVRFFGSSLKDDVRYTPSDCFETYPFPTNFEHMPSLESTGKAYYEFRAALMVKNNEGLTKTYNRFHKPDEHSPDIQKLRDLHAQMDRAVLDAYGWSDIQPAYDFREQLDESTRLTWGEETRDEVLARLLELNRVMAEEEAKAAMKETNAKSAVEKKAKKAKRQDNSTMDLFGAKGK